MKKVGAAVAAKFREWFSLDYRSLALLRITIGITILSDLIQRAEDLRAFYSDQGVLPRAQLLGLGSNQWALSVHMMSGLPSVEAVLFLIAGIAALMLIVGYRTRLAIIVSWFLLISLHFRNPMVLQGGDVLFRVIVFWMMFLPIAQRWSLDRLLNRIDRPTQKTVFSAATVAYILQICVFYIFTGLLKSGIAWHNGTAVYYALHVDQLVRPFGVYLRGHAQFMNICTYGVWYMETFGVILFFSPYKTGFFRTVGIVLFALMQVAFNSAMHLGLFGVIVVSASLGLLPSGFWDNTYASFIHWLRGKGKTGLSIYYDEDCTFCAKVSSTVKNVLVLNSETLLQPASRNAEAQHLMLEKDSWVVADNGGTMHTGWYGLVTVISYSPVFFWLRRLFILKPVNAIGEKIYRRIAEKRQLVCLPEVIPATPTTKQRVGKIVLNIFILGMIAYIICWNIDTLGGGKKIILPNLQWIGYSTHVDQSWTMFAPTPLVNDGWYVFPGTLRDGTAVDVFTGKPFVSYDQPASIANGYKNQRWQKYLMNLQMQNNAGYRLGYAQYLCRQWNGSHAYSQQLLTFNIVFMQKVTASPGEVPNPILPLNLWTHTCF